MVVVLTSDRCTVTSFLFLPDLALVTNTHSEMKHLQTGLRFHPEPQNAGAAACYVSVFNGNVVTRVGSIKMCSNRFHVEQTDGQPRPCLECHI